MNPSMRGASPWHRWLALPLVIVTMQGCAVGAAEPGADDRLSKACRAPEQRQFDFWIGDWDVSNAAGETVGRNTIRRIAGGCALHEDWAGRGGFTGQSLNAWNAATKRWQQTWLDSAGGRLDLVGQAEDGGMRLEGEAPDADQGGRLQKHRIRWSPLPDGRVRQHWETSTDGGANWSTAFDGYYRRRGAVLQR